MEFLSPFQDGFLDKEFAPIIRQAKDRQLNYSIEKIKEFNFLDDRIIDEIMPDDTPEILLKRRCDIKNKIYNGNKRI